jgi:hypothetical protein
MRPAEILRSILFKPGRLSFDERHEIAMIINRSEPPMFDRPEQMLEMCNYAMAASKKALKIRFIY